MESDLMINENELVVVYKDKQSEIDVLNNAIKELQKQKKAKQKSLDETKDKIKEVMLEHGIEKAEFGGLRFTFRKSKSVVVDDKEKFIEHCRNTNNDFLINEKTIVEVDKRMVSEWLKNNKSDYVHIEEKDNLQIKEVIKNDE